MRVAVRELKAHLSKYLQLVKTSGKPVIVTSRDAPVAKLGPVPDATAPKLQQLVQQGAIHWNGRKPKGGRVRPRIAGKTAAARILEDRG